MRTLLLSLRRKSERSHCPGRRGLCSLRDASCISLPLTGRDMRELSWGGRDRHLVVLDTPHTVLGLPPPGQLPPGQLPPDNHPPDNYPPRTVTPRTITPQNHLPPNRTITPHHPLSPFWGVRWGWGLWDICYDIWNHWILKFLDQQTR